MIDDGSTDQTAHVAEGLRYSWLRLLRQPVNRAKPAALNRALAEARFDVIITLDADSSLYATWSLRPSPRTGIELLAASDLVETQPALERATAYAFAGASAERQLTQRFTAIGLAGYQRFSDGNERVHLRGRLIWMLLPEQGLSAQLRVRQYESQQLDVDGAYFNPGRYREWQAGLAMRKRSAGWTWAGALAAGREQIDHDDQRTTLLADVRTEGMLRENTRLVLHASYQRSAGFTVAAADDGYWYGVAGASVIVSF